MRWLRENHYAIRFTALVGMLLAVYGVTVLMSESRVVVFPLLFSIFALPFILGVMTEWLFGGSGRPKSIQLVGIGFAAHMVATGLILLTGNETAICLIMAIPVHIVILWLTIWLIQRKQKDNGSKLNIAFAGLPLVMIALDIFPIASTKTYSVETAIDIAADPAMVWAHTIEIAPIADEERPWTVSHNILGMPRPVQSQLKAGVRHGQWTSGIAFEERIAGMEQARFVTWTFAFPDPVALAAIDTRIRPGDGMVDLLGGGYRIIPTETGSQLILRTNYRLTSYGQLYLSAWGGLFLKDIHNAVLHVVKLRAEGNAAISQEEHQI